ncbi:hypothetical protein XENOCAPTIV_028174, partial [Xenoophorus captivus]
ENDHLYFVFEYMRENLYQLMNERVSPHQPQMPDSQRQRRGDRTDECHAAEKESEAPAEPNPVSLCKTEQDSSKFSKTQAGQPPQQILVPLENRSRPTEGLQEPLSLVKNMQPGSMQAVGSTQVKTFECLSFIKEKDITNPFINGCIFPELGKSCPLFLFKIHFNYNSSICIARNRCRNRDQFLWASGRTPTMGPHLFQVCRLG